MSTAAFDTLKLARRLEASGMTGQQAAGVAEALAETMVADPATRTDLLKLEHALRGDVKELEAKLRGDMKDLESTLRGDVQGLRGELHTEIAKLRGEMVAGFATVKIDILRWIVPLILAQMGLTLGLFTRLAG